MGRYADMVWHICLLHAAQRADAQDAFQDTFLKHLSRGKPFESDEHEKAWLIRVAINTCNDQHKRAHRSDEELPEGLRSATPDQPGGPLSDVLDAMSKLPADQRQALYLNAVQGYTAEEVARMMGSTAGTVYSWVSRARAKLKELLR